MKKDGFINDSDILQELYNSNINFSITSAFWDNRIDWELGDDAGFNQTGSSHTNNVSLAIWDMGVQAMIEFPKSEFAKYFKTLQC